MEHEDDEITEERQHQRSVAWIDFAARVVPAVITAVAAIVAGLMAIWGVVP